VSERDDRLLAEKMDQLAKAQVCCYLLFYQLLQAINYD